MRTWPRSARSRPRRRPWATKALDVFDEDEAYTQTRIVWFDDVLRSSYFCFDDVPVSYTHLTLPTIYSV